MLLYHLLVYIIKRPILQHMKCYQMSYRNTIPSKLTYILLIASSITCNVYCKNIMIDLGD